MHLLGCQLEGARARAEGRAVAAGVQPQVRVAAAAAQVAGLGPPRVKAAGA